MKSPLLWVLFLALLSGAGRVQTRDGKTLEGELSLADDAVIVRPASGGESRIQWDQVARATWDVAPVPQIRTSAPNASLPEGWKSQDIGSVKSPGSAACDGKGAFTLTASGWGAWGAKDSLHFAYRTLEGDGQIIAHVSKLDDTHGPVVAGLMIRESLAADAPMGGACLYPSGEVRLPRRPTTAARDFKHAEDLAPQSWLRLTRRGDVLTAFRSNDGKYWQFVDSHKVPMGKAALVGIAAWTTGNSWIGGAKIDSIQVIPGTPGLSYFPGGDPLIQGIVLRDGSILAATLVSADQTALKFERDGKGDALPIEQVARLTFSPVPPDLARPTDKRGILLANGDFIEGDFTGLALQPVDWPRPQQLKAAVRSVLFGSRSFEVGREVIAIDLAPVTPAPAAYEVRTADGSLIRAQSVIVRQGAVVVDDRPMTNVADVRKL